MMNASFLFFICLLTSPLIGTASRWRGYNIQHLQRCGENTACALSAALSENEDAKGRLICHALHNIWSVVPLTNEAVSEIYQNDVAKHQHCSVPLDTAKILALGAGSRADNFTIWNRSNGFVNVFTNDCLELPEKRQVREEIGVLFEIGDTCVCNTAPHHENRLGMSQCMTMLDIVDTEHMMCQLREKNIKGKCPFRELYSPANSAHYWICGGRAISVFPANFSWTGCCYPGVVATGLQLLHRMDYSIHQPTGPEQVMTEYKGHDDPWTTLAASIRLEILPVGETVNTLEKIYDLAYMLKSLAIDIFDTAVLFNEDLKAIRMAVFQNRLTIDLLIANVVGMCKVLNTSCCFSIPENFQNVNDLIKHMNNVAVDPPQVMNDELFEWFYSWKGLCTILMQIGIIILVALCLAPCVLRLFRSVIFQSMLVVLDHELEDSIKTDSSV